jgi:hypothetical protein
MECHKLIGLDYEPAADGSNGKIDCIWLVYKVLHSLGVTTPPFNWEWYKNNYRLIYRSLLEWGKPIRTPLRDGDVLVLPDDNWAFAVVWQSGFLHIHPATKKVAWSPLGLLGEHRAFRCSLLSDS